MSGERAASQPSAVANLRDLGGIAAADGALVAPGVLFRSASLSAPGAEEALGALGVRTVFDLRTADEASSAPDRVPGGARAVALDVLADSSLSVAATLGSITSNPQGFADSLAGGKAERLFEETYRDLVRLPSAQHAYRAFVLDLADPAREGAALFHCTTGKDRTGWAAALVLSILGASEDAISADYMRTNTDLLPALEPVFAALEAQGVSRATVMPVLGVRESYLDAAFGQVREQYGDVARYATEGLGLPPEALTALRARML
ncbi:tyrosine-protein phosphatase [Leucobacter sp. BZR 635]